MSQLVTWWASLSDNTHENLMKLTFRLAVISQYTYIKFYIKLIFEQILEVPAFSKPSCAVLVGFKSKPVVVCFFIVFYILKKRKNAFKNIN